MIPQFQINHIGFITNNIPLFESFWCQILGFKLKQETFLEQEMAFALFEISSSAIIRRYGKEGVFPDIETHSFQDKKALAEFMPFNRYGLNHLCIHTGGPGSRKQLIDGLPPNVKIHEYKNPKGWTNWFIRDYEGNWIELRENLP